MEKHEKIWVKGDSTTYSLYNQRLESVSHDLQSRDNVIVLSVEELRAIFRNVWQEAQLSIDKDNGFDIPGEEDDGPVAKNAEEYFTTYLQSKGITL